MKNEIMTIIKKELFRFFTDKRMVLVTILMPGLMIYVMYSIMGSAMQSMSSKGEDEAYSVSAVHMPEKLIANFEESGLEVKDISAEKAEALKTQIQAQEKDLLLVFPENFVNDAEAYEIETAEKAAPNVEIYYNSVSTTSAEAYNLAENTLNSYEKSLSNKFDINESGEKNDLAKDEDVTGQVFSMLFPMLMMMFLFSGCMAVAPESIAGEKERGTMATLLATPIKRSNLAMGKIISLSIISLLSGISSFVGVLISLPKMMGGAMDTSFYGMMDYLLILLVILTTVLVFVSLISVISAYSNSVKEASTAVMPLMIVVMVLGLTSMFGNSGTPALSMYLIPIYNSVLCMDGIFSFSYQMPAILLTCGVNVVVTLIVGGLLNRIFSSEKIMFGK